MSRVGKLHTTYSTYKKGKFQSLLCATRHLDIVHIPIQLNEDIMNGY